MKFDVKFKGIDHSQSLADHVVDRFNKLDKFEIKPTNVHVTFSHIRHNCNAEIYVKGVKTNFRAKAHADSYHDALEAVMGKLERQMEKEKSKVKHHKNYDRSHDGRLEAAAELERLAQEKDERESA